MALSNQAKGHIPVFPKGKLLDTNHQSRRGLDLAQHSSVSLILKIYNCLHMKDLQKFMCSHCYNCIYVTPSQSDQDTRRDYPYDYIVKSCPFIEMGNDISQYSLPGEYNWLLSLEYLPYDSSCAYKIYKKER